MDVVYMVEPLPFLEEYSYALQITQLIYFVLSFLLMYFVGYSLVKPLLRRSMDRRGMDRHARNPIMKVYRAGVLIVAVGVAFGFAGFTGFLSSISTVAAAGTLAVGFALQSTIRNFVAGIFIYIDKPFRIDDWIEWDDYKGVVEDISLRVTRVRSFDNEILTVPNSVLTGGVIINPVANNKLRLKFTFGIGYSDDIGKASEIILKEAQDHPGILDDPGPSVRLTELADSYVGLQSRIWIKNPTRSDFTGVRSDYIQSVKKRFDEEGINIPFPQREILGELDINDSLDSGDSDEDM